MWWTVPAQEMLLCNLPGAGGPEGAEPKPRDQREPPTAGGTPEDKSVAHETTKHTAANHKPAWWARMKKDENKPIRTKNLKGSEKRINDERKSEEKRGNDEVHKEKICR